jgi:predicted nucleic acid-binding Zn ribbon protein
MGRRTEEEAEWDNEGWDGDESDEEGNDEEPTIPCPYCRREIHEESQQCPHCGQYISEEDASARRKPWWIIIGVLLCLLVIWCWIARGL